MLGGLFSIALFVVILLLFFGLAIIITLASKFLSVIDYFISLFTGKRRTTQFNDNRHQASSSSSASASSTTSAPQQRTKIIPKEEGEYVDFEEV